MHGAGETAAAREGRWAAQLAALRELGVTRPGLVAEVVLADIEREYGPLVPLGRLDRAAARAAVREGRVVGFRQERNLGSGDVFVVDASRERGAQVAFVLPEPLRVGDVAPWLAANPWEAISELIGWLADQGAIATADETAR